jgi:hypothetical protein
MPSFAMGFFCEDVREEIAGTQTVVGVFPDNIVVPSVPATLPKLALYLRFMLDPSVAPGAISASLTFSNAETKEVVALPAEAGEDACRAARESGMPYAGLMTIVIMQHFNVIMAGRLVATVKMGGAEQVCAVLNFRLPDASSNELAPPVER